MQPFNTMQSLQPEILQNKGTKRQLHFLDNIISSIYMENKIKNENEYEKKKKNSWWLHWTLCLSNNTSSYKILVESD